MRIDARSTAVLAAVAAALAVGCTRTDPNRFGGYAEAEFVYVAPAISGRVQTVDVQRGQRVEKGAELFRLEPDPEAYDRAAAAARAEQAASSASNLRKGKREDELRVIEHQLGQARAALALSSAELERNAALVKQGFIAPGRLDELRSARDRDAAQVAQYESQLKVARLAARPDEIAAAEAAQRAAESDLGRSRWREQQARGVAPVTATVQDLTYRVGEWVPQGAPIVTLLPDGAVKVRFFVPQEALSRLAPGDTVNVACDGCPAGMTATVRFIATQAEFTPPVIYSNESRSKLVFMAEAQPQGEAASRLRPGQPVDVRLAR
jgi:HlyD family secretion protein